MGSILKSTMKGVTGKGGLAGLGSTFALLLVRSCLRKPGIQAYMDSLCDRLFPTGEACPALPTGVLRTADSVVRLFREQGFVPSRLAVDGPPGSGKTSLAKALAGRLGMDAVCLDHQDLDHPLDFTRCNAIYEHHRLLRTQNIDAFDALLYIDEPVEISRQRVLQRKRGGYLVEVLDYQLLKRIGDKAFACADGTISSLPDCGLRIKFRPTGGFRDRACLERELLFAGHDGTGLSKEAALFLDMQGAAASGFKAYLNMHALDGELLHALTESMLLYGRGKGMR